MTLDDLMEVWRSQDASPLHGVNETLLRLALRQDEAKLQERRRLLKRITNLTSAVLIAGMALFLVLMVNMLFDNDDDVIAGWDLAIPIVGAAAALFMSVHLYVTRRARALREQRFGDSLRDQLGRRIAQLDDEATRGTRLMSMLLLPLLVCAIAIRVAGTRVNLEPNEAFDGWPAIVRITVVFAIIWGASVWAARRSAQRDVLPRQRRLEALLKELDRP
jgi:hypothetical protein